MVLQRGAELGQPECIAELADYYYHFYEQPALRRHSVQSNQGY